MNLSFNQTLAQAYTSNSQKIRVMSEHWVANSIFCPNCGASKISQFDNNNPAADYFCTQCHEQYELKSKDGNLGAKIVDGAYQTMIQKVEQGNNPNFFFMTYEKSSLTVKNLIIIPKHFFTHTIIEKRKPLADTARRAGWVGCNLLLNEIPSSGKIFVIQNTIVHPKNEVLNNWKKMLFLKDENTQTKGWLLDMVSIIESMKKPIFSLNDLYAFETKLAQKHSNNRHIKAKIRQQLQILRDKNYLEFVGNGVYKTL